MPEDPKEQWKEKYLATLDILEKTQTENAAQIELLRKGLVRISLAADGLDASLDDQLEQLRAALRNDNSSSRLEPLLKQLEHTVVSLDDRRKDEHTDIQQLLEAKLERFSELNLPRQERDKISQLRKTILKLIPSNGINPDLWRSFIHVQDSVTEHLLSEVENSSGHKEGLLSKFFRGKSSNTEKKPAEAATTNEINDAASSEDIKSGHTHESTTHRHLIFNFRSNLNKLLDQLDVSQENSPLKKSLVEQINQEFEIERVPNFIEEVAHLITSTRLVAQKEYEGFLVALHQRLHEVQEFLTNARQDEIQSKASQQQLDQDVRQELRDIRESVDKRTEMDKLKLDIEGMINRIASSVDKFQNDQKQRRDQVYERIETLANRMESMESEASELKNSLELQRLEALKDSLTELPNRASYDEYINNEFSRWKRHGRPVSLAIIDIDHFKSINDTLGHLRGDKVLKLVAREISRRVRQEDFVARYGGEEFVVVLPETPLDAALEAMDKVRKAVADCPFNFNQQPIPVSASVGIAEFEAGDTIETCFERADKALYEAKRTGRNRSVRSPKEQQPRNEAL